MSQLQVGQVRVLLGAGNTRRESSKVFGSEVLEGDVAYAMMVGPGETQLDVRYFIADEGVGLVTCTARASSDEAFERLIRGARLGVYRDGDEECVVRQLRLLHWDAESGWGNPRKTDVDELDELLGSSSADLFSSLGVSAFGAKEEVLGGSGSDLAMRWSESEGVAPAFAAYALTRVLPIVRALGLEDE